MTAIRKILVVRLSSIGDIILTTPFLRSLRSTYPNARIFFVIKKQFAELLACSPYVDELITFDTGDGFAGLRKIRNYLKEQKIDACFDIHKNWRSMYLRCTIGAGNSGTYSKQILNRTLLIWLKINIYRGIKPVVERYFEAGLRFGLKYDGRGTEITVNKETEQKVRNALSKAGYKFDVPLVVICPGAAHFNKRWHPEGFITTARSLINVASAFMVVHGGRADASLCQSIADNIGRGVVNFAGSFSLAESAALLKFSSVVIANDSGLLHMAQAQKVPVVAIYGPTTRELGYFPLEENSTVIEIPLYCRPCTHNGLEKCPRKHFRCMNEITADQVITASMKYLN